MAENYREVPVTGTSRPRARAINISNETDEAPVATFLEENVVTLDTGKVYKENIGSLIVPFCKDEVIDLISPENDVPLGTTATHSDLYVILYSLYIQEVKKRDAQRVAISADQ